MCNSVLQLRCQALNVEIQNQMKKGTLISQNLFWQQNMGLEFNTINNQISKFDIPAERMNDREVH